MKRRTIIGLLLGLLYGSALLAFQAGRHDHHAGEQDCSVCVWHAVAQTDTPIVAIQPVYSELNQPVLLPAVVRLTVTFASATAARAPPEASA